MNHFGTQAHLYLMLKKIIQFNLHNSSRSDASSQPLSLVSGTAREPSAPWRRKELETGLSFKALEPLGWMQKDLIPRGAIILSWKEAISEMWCSQGLVSPQVIVENICIICACTHTHTRIYPLILLQFPFCGRPLGAFLDENTVLSGWNSPITGS